MWRRAPCWSPRKCSDTARRRSASIKSVGSAELSAALVKRCSELECFEKFAIVELVDAQAPEGAQAIVLVIEPVRQFEGGCRVPGPHPAHDLGHTSATSRGPPRAACASVLNPYAPSSSCASANSVRSRHSPNSDRWTQSGTAAAVNAAPICESPSAGECPFEGGTDYCRGVDHSVLCQSACGKELLSASA